MSDKPAIHEALAAVMNDVKVVKKGERNEAQRFNFRGIDAVLNAVGPVLRHHKVMVLPPVLEHHFDSVLSSTGKAMGHVTVKVEYRFIGPAGDSLTCTVMGESMDMGDKATTKAMSVALRTALLQSLALPTDEPDPDLDVYERGAARDTGKVGELLDLFASCSSEDDLGVLATTIVGLELSQADKEILRTAYGKAKERLEQG